MPEISIILPLYNSEKYILEAINSILNQSYKDFDLYILNDGSSDNSANIVEQIKDKRVKVYHNEKNEGLIYTLNKGLELVADSKYIARMDADDIALTNRLSKQHHFLETHKDIGLVGCAMELFDENTSTTKKVYRPSSSDKIASTFLFYNPISHPTVMFRAETFNKGYRYSYEYPKYEDYHLWISMFGEVKFHNLNEVLLRYRRHPNTVGASLVGTELIDHGFGKKLIEVFCKKNNLNLTKEEIETISIISSKIRYSVNPEFKLNYLNTTMRSISLKLNKTFDRYYFEYLFQEKILLYLMHYKRYTDVLKLLANMSSKSKRYLLESSLLGKRG